MLLFLSQPRLILSSAGHYDLHPVNEQLSSRSDFLRKPARVHTYESGPVLVRVRRGKALEAYYISCADGEEGDYAHFFRSISLLAVCVPAVPYFSSEYTYTL